MGIDLAMALAVFSIVLSAARKPALPLSLLSDFAARARALPAALRFWTAARNAFNSAPPPEDAAFFFFVAMVVSLFLFIVFYHFKPKRSQNQSSSRTRLAKISRRRAVMSLSATSASASPNDG